MSSISEKLKRKIRQQAKNRCGYRLLPQSLNLTPELTGAPGLSLIRGMLVARPVE